MTKTHTKAATPPVLLIAFRRPETTKLVFESIRQAKPQRLYIFSDGPRSESEEQICLQTRAVVSQIDWDCTVERLYLQENWGVQLAIPAAISWFFRSEEEGIILEDDCVPHEDFYHFCGWNLERYRNSTEIMQISGTNYQPVRRTDDSYFFSRYAHVWGFATWRRAWNQYVPQLSKYDDFFEKADRGGFWEDRRERHYWHYIYDQIAQGKVESWAYRWTFCLWLHGGLCVYPEANLVKNVGFGPGATNTCDKKALAACRPTQVMPVWRHPLDIRRHQVADRFTFDVMYWGRPFERFRHRIHKANRVLTHFWQHKESCRPQKQVKVNPKILDMEKQQSL